MPSVVIYNPFSSRRSGPRVANPMFKSVQPEPAAADPKPEQPAAPLLPDIALGESMLEDGDLLTAPRRNGKLKTVGGSSDDDTPAEEKYDIPDFDFGPTFNFGAKELPMAKVRAVSGAKAFNSSSSSLGSVVEPHSPEQSRPKTMNEQWRQLASSGALASSSRPGTSMSHFRTISGESHTSMRPESRHLPAAHQRRPSSSLLSSLSVYPRSGGGVSRSTTALPMAPTTRLLTPEGIEHVHSRSHSITLGVTASPAASPAPPQTPQSRSPSHSPAPSQSYTLAHAHSRTPSAESPSAARPRSRAASSMLDFSGHRQSRASFGGSVARPELISHLSAREQERVARATHGPLISLCSPAGGNGTAAQRARSTAQLDGSGLVGAIDVRQREKEQLRASGAYNPSVAYAIRERQAAQVMQQMQAAQMQSVAFQNQQMQMALQTQWEQQQIQSMAQAQAQAQAQTQAQDQAHSVYAQSAFGASRQSFYGMQAPSAATLAYY